jgi:hypothetical protein
MLRDPVENLQPQPHLDSAAVAKPSAATTSHHKSFLTPTLTHQTQVQLKPEFYISGRMVLA